MKPPSRRITASLAAVAATALVFTGCSNTASPQEDSATASSPLIIFAAASLQGSFDELAERFEAEHPEYPVDPIVYDGSQALATQIVDGADVDVIAFANEPSFEPVANADAADQSTIFATNTLQIAVAPGNPQGIDDLDDLASGDLSVVLCAPEVPCGAASQTLLDDAGVSVTPVSEETNVTSVVTRVKNGEADAGLVYATDVAAAGDELEGITPSNADAAVNRYPIAVSNNAPSPDAAQSFVDYVLSDAGQKILATYGFGSP
ncbi:molybdate ABC transporter substrate-binding protein [Paramicrobacterium chengjingii]|uniref:Molybdate ABC transporter substrate-binding protein n=1 Tax=Paramicrobacterium chengjingii TaxID=2769067 RepID=A0ABX6YFF2_9MICO|nr:molybdate ABC transporter substrate-binding protein [Microbacterium chengjingii]QPZ37522.1 molybdate ABC transporter substrate-binding protein [Microbacterium chengjingii]